MVSLVKSSCETGSEIMYSVILRTWERGSLKVVKSLVSRSHVY